MKQGWYTDQRLIHNAFARYMKFSKKNYNVRLHSAFISGTIRVLIEIVEPIAEGQEIVAELLNGNMTDGGSDDMDTPLGTIISFSSSFTAAELDLFREVVSTWTLIAEIREIADPDHMYVSLLLRQVDMCIDATDNEVCTRCSIYQAVRTSASTQVWCSTQLRAIK